VERRRRRGFKEEHFLFTDLINKQPSIFKFIDIVG
jgi:hypothetical protein